MTDSRGTKIEPGDILQAEYIKIKYLGGIKFEHITFWELGSRFNIFNCTQEFMLKSQWVKCEK